MSDKHKPNETLVEYDIVCVVYHDLTEAVLLKGVGAKSLNHLTLYFVQIIFIEKIN